MVTICVVAVEAAADNNSVNQIINYQHSTIVSTITIMNESVISII